MDLRNLKYGCDQWLIKDAAEPMIYVAWLKCNEIICTVWNLNCFHNCFQLFATSFNFTKCTFKVFLIFIHMYGALKSKDKAAVKYIEKHVDRWVKKAGQIQVQAHGNCFL